MDLQTGRCAKPHPCAKHSIMHLHCQVKEELLATLSSTKLCQEHHFTLIALLKFATRCILKLFSTGSMCTVGKSLQQLLNTNLNQICRICSCMSSTSE